MGIVGRSESMLGPLCNQRLDYFVPKFPHLTNIDYNTVFLGGDDGSKWEAMLDLGTESRLSIFVFKPGEFGKR